MTNSTERFFQSNEKESPPFPWNPFPLPALTVSQMIEVDRAMVEDFGISLLQMMENAGRHLAEAARRLFLGGQAADRNVLILAGRGGNGGGALVAARHLANAGANVVVWLSAPEENFSGVPAHQMKILKKMGVPLTHEAPSEKIEKVALLLDGLVGYSLRGELTDRAKKYVELANQATVPKLSLDVPSGLNATTGAASGAVVRADATLTLALPKTGLLVPEAHRFVGKLFLGDIGVPPALYARRLNFDLRPIFSASSILRIF